MFSIIVKQFQNIVIMFLEKFIKNCGEILKNFRRKSEEIQNQKEYGRRKFGVF